MRRWWSGTPAACKSGLRTLVKADAGPEPSTSLAKNRSPPEESATELQAGMNHTLTKVKADAER